MPADGKDPVSGQVDPLLSPKLLARAFALPQGGDTDEAEQDTDKGEYYAVHVDQVLPSSLPSLEEPGIRQALTQRYMQQAIIDALQKKGDEAQASLKKGQTFEAVAAAHGAKLAHQVGLQRIAAQQYAQTFGQPFLATVFNGKAGDIFAVASDQLQGLVIGRVDTVKPAETRQVAQLLEMVRQRLTSGYLEGLDEAARAAAVKLIKPTTDDALARSAIGVDAAMAARVDKASKTASAAAGAKPAK